MIVKTLWINKERKIAQVSPNIFGSFTENLYNCIYGGVYDPSSLTADVDGFREDVMDGCRKMGVSSVRFPGGCFAPYYHWIDGIGPKEQRPLTRYRQLEENIEVYPPQNHFGTDEYLNWCHKIHAQPYICVNMGSGTPEEARNWVEYCNGLAGSRWANLRIINGHPEPYRVKLWALGNEISAPWEFGYTDTPQEYIRKAREFARVMKAADPTIKLVISGAHFPIDFPHRNWNREVLSALYEYTDYISMHHYIGHDYKDEITHVWKELGSQKVHYTLTEYMRLLEDAYQIVREDIRLINHEKNEFKQIGIALDEYNPWYKSDGRMEHFNLSDSLLVGAYFNIFIRNSDVAVLCNMAQLVNVIPSMICESGGTRFYRQGISYIQEMFLENSGNESIDAWIDSDTYAGQYFEKVSYLDVSASYKAKTNCVIVNIINRNHELSYSFNIQVAGEVIKNITGHLLGNDSIDASNSYEQPTRLSIRPTNEILNGIINIPPMSLGVYRVEL